MNEISHGTHHPVSVRDIFDCTGHMEGRNTNNYRFIINFMEVMKDELDPKKELIDLINFDGAKAVQVAVDILDTDRLNLTFRLFTLHGAKTFFSDI